jgi:adenylosuccinate lyase
MEAKHVCVFEWRYGTEDMKRLFNVENVVSKYVEVELALYKGLVEAGIAPIDCLGKILECVKALNPRDVYELEKALGHDVASLVFRLEELCGECGRYIHYGATSYDIVDTAWALILREALCLVEKKLVALISGLEELAKRYAETPVVGRTHGQHATPITFGFKFANYAYKLARALERLEDVKKRLIRAKISGSTGVMAVWGEKGLIIEEVVCRELKLEPHLISTQVAPRDGFAELASALGILASQLDRFALEVRELSRTEIGELYESVERVGSSAMPHKRNPVIAERISGLAKVARSFVLVALENIPLMHERDLTNSSSERVWIPHLLLTIDQMLEDAYRLLSTLRVDEEAAKRNIDLTRGAVFSELILSKLVEKGWPRREAYRVVRELVDKTGRGESIVDAALRDPRLSKVLTREELEEITSPQYATRMARVLIDRALSYVEGIKKRVELSLAGC